MNPLGEMWQSSDIGLTSAQQATATRLRAWLRTYDLTLSLRGLRTCPWEGPPLTCTEKQMEDLQKNIELQFGSCKACHEALVVLGKFIAFVNGAGKGAHPPATDLQFSREATKSVPERSCPRHPVCPYLARHGEELD